MGKKKPTKPKTLVEFLRAKGGVKDEAGDLASREPDKDLKPFQRKLIQKKGMHLDTAREAAAEAGYIPKDSSLSDLLDAIDEELRGRLVWSRGDVDEIAGLLLDEEQQPAPELGGGLEGEGPPGGKGESLEYQLAYVVRRKEHPNVPRAKREARLYFLRTGENIPGVRIIAKWRNPENKNPLHANWKTTEDPGHSLMDFWLTLHKDRGALQGLALIDDREEVQRASVVVKQSAMKAYHEKVRSLRQPGWSYKRARRAYRRLKKRKRK